MNADWYHLHSLLGVTKRIAISLSRCAHWQQKWWSYIVWKFGALYCLVTPEMTELICVPCTCVGWKSTYTPWFVVLPFRNATQFWNADERINSGDDQATPDINLVGFWLIPPDFMKIICVQRASISTLVSISILVVRLFFATARWGVTLSGLYARHCHTFLVCDDVPFFIGTGSGTWATALNWYAVVNMMLPRMGQMVNCSWWTSKHLMSGIHVYVVRFSNCGFYFKGGFTSTAL